MKGGIARDIFCRSQEQFCPNALAVETRIHPFCYHGDAGHVVGCHTPLGEPHGLFFVPGEARYRAGARGNVEPAMCRFATNHL